MTAIIDYDAGNLKSVEKALALLGEDAVITRDADVIKNADRVILPGVGSFGMAMEQLQKYNLCEVIREVCSMNIPFLGICLGLQLLFDGSDETPDVPGLGILKGRILRIPDAPGLKIPHIGWNDIHYPNKGRLYTEITEGAYVYFVHSYYLNAADKSIVTATTRYGEANIEASVECGNVFACQFHPEKSGDVGLNILKQFIGITR